MVYLLLKFSRIIWCALIVYVSLEKIMYIFNTSSSILEWYVNKQKECKLDVNLLTNQLLNETEIKS